MEIDWITVAAQIVNFLVLVWLLRRFLYGPIVRAMKGREARIEGRLTEARETREAAAREKADLEAERAELEAQRERMLEAARTEAGELRERLERELREEVEARREDWGKRLEAERARFLDALRRRAAGHAYAMLRGLLADFADADLSERVAARFAERLEGLDADTRRAFAEAAGQAGGAALVETNAALPSQARARIARALHEAISADVEPEFRADDALALGVRLTVGGRVLDWTAAAHLDRLEARVDADLDALRHAPAGAERGAA